MASTVFRLWIPAGHTAAFETWVPTQLVVEAWCQTTVQPEGVSPTGIAYDLTLPSGEHLDLWKALTAFEARVLRVTNLEPAEAPRPESPNAGEAPDAAEADEPTQEEVEAEIKQFFSDIHEGFFGKRPPRGKPDTDEPDTIVTD